MPSLLDLFGTLDLKNDQFNRKLKDSVGQMQTADSQLNKVISSSNKLGDTSATVARRYEKLAEASALNVTRLKETITAYQAGDINGKKFEATLRSIETQTRSLTSRIADAKARVQELNEVGLTHFQQQITTAVSSSNSLSGIFKNLSAYQKQNLSYQANDIISGLLSGQNFTQILAQQGGQIVQVFQQAAAQQAALAAAAGTTATATTAAAASEAQFAASAQIAAVAQGEVAAATEATVAAQNGVGTAVASFGTKLGLVGAIVGVILGDYYLIHHEIDAIEAKGKERLATETKLEAAINAQLLAAQKLNQELSKNKTDSTFNAQLTSGNYNLAQWQNDLQAAYDRDAKELGQKMAQRKAELVGTSDAFQTAELAKLVPSGFNDLQKQRHDQIVAIADQRNKDANSQPSSREWYENAIKGQLDFYNQTAKVQEDAAKKAADAAKALAERMNAAADATKKYIEGLQTKLQGSFGTALTDYQLKREAQEFRQGYKFAPQTVSEKLQGQLASLPGLQSKVITEIVGAASGGDLAPSNLTRTYQQFDFQKNLDPALRRKLDEAIIQATAGADPASLTTGQRQLAAQAREDLVKQDREELIKTLTDLKNAINNGTIVTFKDKSNSVDSITPVTPATPAATAQRY